MKYALLAVVATVGVSGGARAMEIPASAHAIAAPPGAGCGGLAWHAAARPEAPIACCDQAFGCAQFLATTRVQVQRHRPRT
jgi:hypothetical protein